MLYSVFQVKPLLGLFWTLEVELVFYFLCLMLFLCGALHRPLALFSIGIALLFVFRTMVRQQELMQSIGQELGPHWRLMPWHLALMLWGGLFRMWYDNRQRVVSVGFIKIPIIVFVVVLMIAFLVHPVSYSYQWISNGKYQHLRQFIPYFLGIALFVIFALYIKVKGNFFVWLGAVSYSLYLVHPIVFYSLLFAIKRYYPELSGMHLSVYLLASVALSLALSGLVYRIIEKPAIRLGQHFRRS
jgi:peptidoglycan/LPS O-acetylase OafA/YrhL